MSKPPKKSETIEIRLSHEAKTAFMARCRDEQRTASETIRLMIEQTPASRPDTETRRVPHWRVVLAALVGMGLGIGAAAPSLARSSDTTRGAFDRLDRNRDGFLSYAEFRSR